MIIQIANDHFSRYNLSHKRLDQAISNVYESSKGQSVSTYDEAMMMVPSLITSAPLKGAETYLERLVNAYFALVVGMEWSGYKLFPHTSKLKWTNLAKKITESGFTDETKQDFKKIRALALKSRGNSMPDEG